MRKVSHSQMRKVSQTQFMRRALSDPVLIKPSHENFLVEWNAIEQAPSIYDKDADPLYGILIRIAELDLSGVPRHSSAEERYKIGQKVERQQRRRHSIMLANLRDAGYTAEGLKESSSAPDILQLCFSSHMDRKRVSFGIEAILPPSYHSGLASPSSPNARPILLKKCIDQIDTTLPLSHMDFDTFAAWRRGSKMSIDLQAKKRKESKSSIPERPEPHHPLAFVKSALISCFQRRSYCRTRPDQSF
ncbi:unnamed protein product, partial [Mesorhabditis spiculigera]